MQTFKTTLSPDALPQYLEGLDRLGLVYHFVVGDRGHTSSTHNTMLQLVVDGSDDRNSTILILKSDGTWKMETRIAVGEDK